MTILGFNPSHHGSVCLLQDGEITYFIQEERLTKEKYDGYPFKTFIEVLQNNTNIDYLTWGSPSLEYPLTKRYHLYPYWGVLATKYSSEIKSLDLSPENHHICHAAHSFYNSGFNKAIGVVIDGYGSNYYGDKDIILGQETESIFCCSYPLNFKILYKNIIEHPSYDSSIRATNQGSVRLGASSVNLDYTLSDSYKIPLKPNIDINKGFNLSRVYEEITMYLGWSLDEAGKTMGLAPYGKNNPNLPNFLQNKTGHPDIFREDSEGNYLFNPEQYPQLKLPRDPREWHYDESKITDLEKDLAWKVQNDTQQLVGDYIEKAIKETGLKQVCCSGGYFLNCVTNYYLLKRFPDIEFYFEPISNDAGTAIGAAKLVWYHQTKDTTIRPFKSLYLGKQYSKEELLKGIKKYT